MKQFFYSFLGSLLAVFICFIVSVLGIIVFFIILFNSDTSSESITINPKSVLVIDLGKHYDELDLNSTAINSLLKDKIKDNPNLFELTQLIKNAAKDSLIAAIYLKCRNNANGRAASEEIRDALLEFKKNGKPIIAYGETISEQSYFVANVASPILTNPAGGLSWDGISTEMMFVKGALEKLEIEPQIFYAGKFKSATEPLRATEMSPENKQQTTELINGIYNQLLESTAFSRKLSIEQLKNLANAGSIQSAQDALKYNLVDQLVYEEEVEKIIKNKIKINSKEELELIKPNNYLFEIQNKIYSYNSDNQIALIYLNGDIVDGKGANDEIGGDYYRIVLAEVREKIEKDKNIKAVVLRVNSPGGSALASEVITHEVELIKKLVPVVVSMGNVAASGGYYISCLADRIFADKSTITGSIGVFTIIPNAQKFFNNKLGITFDGISTNPNSKGLSITHPLNDFEKGLVKNGVDSIYAKFKRRVSQGRKIDIDSVEEIAQGRVWSGQKALEIGLVDKLGNLYDALEFAKDLAEIDSYQIITYPKKSNFFDDFFKKLENEAEVYFMKKELGEDMFNQLKQIKTYKNIVGKPLLLNPYKYTGFDY